MGENGNFREPITIFFRFLFVCLFFVSLFVIVKHYHTIDRQEERSAESGSAERSSLKGREKVIVNQPNIDTVSKGNAGETSERRSDSVCGLSRARRYHPDLKSTEVVATYRPLRACHAPRQPLQNRSSRHFGGVEEGEGSGHCCRQRNYWTDNVNIPAHAKSANNGRPQKRLEEDLC